MKKYERKLQIKLAVSEKVSLSETETGNIAEKCILGNGAYDRIQHLNLNSIRLGWGYKNTSFKVR